MPKNQPRASVKKPAQKSAPVAKKPIRIVASSVDPAALPSESTPEADRVDIGLRYPTDVLARIAAALLAEWKHDKASLVSYGFNDPWAAGMLALLARIDALKSNRDAAVRGRKPTGKDLESCLAAGKFWRQRFVAIVNRTPSADEAPKFGSTRRNPLMLAEQLDNLAGFISDHASESESFGGGAAFADEGHKVAAELRALYSVHTDSMRTLSPAAKDLQAAKGTLYLELKSLSRFGLAVLKPSRRERYVLKHLLARKGQQKPPTPPPPAPKAA